MIFARSSNTLLDALTFVNDTLVPSFGLPAQVTAPARVTVDGADNFLLANSRLQVTLVKHGVSYTLDRDPAGAAAQRPILAAVALPDVDPNPNEADDCTLLCDALNARAVTVWDFDGNGSADIEFIDAGIAAGGAGTGFMVIRTLLTGPGHSLSIGANTHANYGFTNVETDIFISSGGELVPNSVRITPYKSPDLGLERYLVQWEVLGGVDRATGLGTSGTPNTELVLAAETAQVDGTTDYYFDMSGYERFTLQLDDTPGANGDNTYTVATTAQDDGTPASECTYLDVTNDWFFAPNFVADAILERDIPVAVKFVRLRVVRANDGAAVDGAWTIHLKRAA